MLCTNCGNENDDDAKFCKICGTPLSNINEEITEKDSNEITESPKKEITTKNKRKPREFNTKSGGTKQIKSSKTKGDVAKLVISCCCLGFVILVIIGMISPNNHNAIDKNNTFNSTDNNTTNLTNNTTSNSTTNKTTTDAVDNNKPFTLTKTINIDLESEDPLIFEDNNTRHRGEMDETTTKTLHNVYTINKDGYEIRISNQDNSKYKSIATKITRLLDESATVSVTIEDSNGKEVENYKWVLTYKKGGKLKTITGDDSDYLIDIPAYSDLIKIEIKPKK